MASPGAAPSMMTSSRRTSSTDCVGGVTSSSTAAVDSTDSASSMVTSAIGVALGLVLSLLLIYVINFQSFGWTIQFALPVGFVVQSLVVVLAATLAAGFYPAALALKVDPIRAIRAE